MRKQNLISGALGLAALALTACSSNDDLSVHEPEKVEFDQERFIAVQISSSVTQTRAFENGNLTENGVQRLDFLFYDSDGNPTATPYPLTNFSGVGSTNSPENSNVARIYTTVVPVTLSQGQNLPTQVICIVNGNNQAVNELKTATLDELRFKVRDTFRSEDNLFVMTNSVYYGKNVLTGASDQRICATPINTASQLFDTEDKAKNAINDGNDNTLVDIYVERIAAKVALTYGGTQTPVKLVNGDSEEVGATVSLTFTPTYWAMNACANEIYLTKRYGLSDNQYPEYSQLNPVYTAAGFTNWNSESNHRSYWACSPSYFEDQYPFVSDDVQDGGVYTVKYLTYNNIISEGERGIAEIGRQACVANNGQFANAILYAKETTTAQATINDVDANPAATVASAVIVGQYSPGEGITMTGSTGGATTTFYVDTNNGISTENGTEGTFYGSYAKARSVLAARQNVIYTSADASETAGASVFTIAHPNQAARENMAPIAGRLVTLQISDNPPTGDNALYYYQLDNEGNGSYVAITTANVAKANAALAASAGYLSMYYNGHGFFNIPIRHLNWKNDYYSADNGYDWENMPIGALGLVRNHSYTITVSSISGLASGLRSDDQPIVPAKDEVNQYIAARLNILSWNIVSNWDVDL